ncbi:proton-conducting transporter transmembrane domain-containing protein [Desulfotalea psychrophila]|uniref:Probable hydrogenase, component F-formate hydrogenlyase subunit 3 n=1 Tax=Desulfotalea psychrophila (strain LSv54 / DSM 12343) TaxID=177439 RepID=Q6APF1_DESPS|nr:proton-conducting transporter membrane subunit [Desulfotalea psychrophila]CAG35773.1 probable hydrogenase, component F-formate hydrogenlyase subunit 3 [Desulfotalea psychrophila LSv54]
MLELIFIIPFVTGISVLILPVQMGRVLLLAVAGLHLVLTAMAWLGALSPSYPQLFGISPEGLLILLLTSFIFICISIYAFSYIEETEVENKPLFNCCMMLFLGTMSMVTLSDHPIVLWIAVEATTLVSAPLIFIHRSQEALEATWKYVLICSVGIALALLGCFFITLSMDLGNIDAPLTFNSLYQVAPQLDPLWLKTGFIFVVIGFGTKMGLAPMHTWLPDAHSQAPSPASALLSGALLNCAFLGIYKVHVLMTMAGLGGFSGNVLVGFGLFSMFVGAIFIISQPDYKRMLAYSSIKNMGVIAFGVGIGGFAVYGAFLHILHHSLIKSSLFLSAGNVLLGFDSKKVQKIGGVVRHLPKTFISLFAGFVGISGLPPFGLFISEVIITIGALQNGRYLPAGLFLFAITLVCAGSGRIFMSMSFGDGGSPVRTKENILRLIPPYALLLMSATICIWMPDALYKAIINSISLIGGTING